MARARALAALLLAASSTTAFAADRSRPPAPGPPRPLRLPPVQRFALGNGLPVLLAEMHEVPTVDLLLLVKSGAEADPLDRAGVASMTADMLDEGAGGKDALALADALEFLGASLATASAWDQSLVRLHVPVPRLAEALPLLTDVALRPDFPARELERLRKEALTSLLEARDEPDAIAGRALIQAVFGRRHRYGRPESGDAASIAALRVDDLRAFHARHYRPGNAVLVVVGDVTAEVTRPRLDAAFASWPRGGQTPPPLSSPAQVSGRQLWLVDKPGAAQSALRVGRVGPPRLNPDYHALEVMNTLLGGSFTSRLNDNLREKHGYAYGAASWFDYRRVGGMFLGQADVQTDATAPAAAELLQELARIRTPAPAEEIERARNYLALGYAWDFETTRQLAGKLAGQDLYGLPGDFFGSFVPKALAVGPPEVERAARAWVDPDNMAFVVVGDRTKIEGPLRALGKGSLRLLTVGDVMGPPPQIR